MRAAPIAFIDLARRVLNASTFSHRCLCLCQLGHPCFPLCVSKNRDFSCSALANSGSVQVQHQAFPSQSVLPSDNRGRSYRPYHNVRSPEACTFAVVYIPGANTKSRHSPRAPAVRLTAIAPYSAAQLGAESSAHQGFKDPVSTASFAVVMPRRIRRREDIQVDVHTTRRVYTIPTRGLQQKTTANWPPDQTRPER